MVSLKDAVTALAAWAASTQAAPAEHYEGTSALSPRASYVTKNGLFFNIDGIIKYFAGTNSYWIGFLTNKADVDLVMTHLQGAGLKSSKYGALTMSAAPATVSGTYQSFISNQSPQINTGANGLQRLDYVVSSAAAHNIKLVINFVNNWSDYGGMALYSPPTAWPATHFPTARWPTQHDLLWL